LQGEFLALFSTPAGNSPEPGATVAYGVATDVSDAGEGVRDGSGLGGVLADGEGVGGGNESRCAGLL